MRESKLRNLPGVAWTLYLATTAGMIRRIFVARSLKEVSFGMVSACAGVLYRIAMPVGLVACWVQVGLDLARPSRTLFCSRDRAVTVTARRYRDGWFASGAAARRRGWTWAREDVFPADA